MEFKKLILIFLLLPSFASALVTVPWAADSSSSGFIYPLKVNGVNQAVLVNGSTTLQKVGATYASTTELQSTSDSWFATGGGRVGIGTINPLTVLDVLGIASSTLFYANAGTAAAPSFSFAGNQNAGMYNGGIANEIRFSTASADRLTIKADGKVGVNTTSPNGQFDISVTTGTNALQITNSSAATNKKWIIFPTTNSVSTDLTFHDTADRVTFQAGGNVGIGTTGPGYKLDVRGAIGDILAGKGQFVALDTTAQAAGVGGSIDLGGNYRSAGDYSAFTRIAAEKANSTDNNYGYNLGFYVTTNGGANYGTKVMTMDSTGNVGIGTTAPGAKLTVTGTSAAQPSSGTSSTAIARVIGSNGAALDFGSAVASPYGLWIQGTDPTNFAQTYPIILNPNGGNVGLGTTGPGAKLGITTAAGGDALILNSVNNTAGTYQYIKFQYGQADTSYRAAIGQSPDVTNEVGGRLSFFTDDTGGTLQNRMTINRSGNVGIGTTNPTNGVLEVTGQVYFSANCSALSFTDRTPFYEGDALAEIKAIKGIDGEIDHTTLPEFARVQRTIIVEPAIEAKEATETEPAITAKEAVTKIQQERDLGAMISILVKAVQQLTDEVELLKVK